MFVKHEGESKSGAYRTSSHPRKGVQGKCDQIGHFFATYIRRQTGHDTVIQLPT